MGRISAIFATACTIILGLFLGVASCTSSDTTMPDASQSMPDTSTPPACPNGYAQCGTDCVAIKRDPTNCGTCGKQCKDGEVCVQGGCALQCGGTTTKCGMLCASTKSDPDNCGMCGQKCPSGQVCSLGKCAVSCAMGLTDCSGACLDLQTDDDNCGMCGNACSPGQRCSMGQCVANCQAGLTSCPNDGGTTCVNLQTDTSNCGACGAQCGNGLFCSPSADGGMATCGLACFGGTTKCGNKCADLQIDPQNCGACGKPCNGTCFNGQCCAGSQVYCGGACRDLKTDKNNCGGCGIACGGPCNNGVCCNAGETICNGKCVDLNFDPNNCGQCGKPCGPDSGTPYCNMGTCVMGCVPNGMRQAFNTLQSHTASGCWQGNPCQIDQYNFSQTYGENFQALNEEIVCSGATACVGHVGIGTYAAQPLCQGAWDVYCNSQKVGSINTNGKTCTGSAMSNGCSTTFVPVICSTLKLVATAGSGTQNCCGGQSPDSMIVAVSAW